MISIVCSARYCKDDIRRPRYHVCAIRSTTIGYERGGIIMMGDLHELLLLQVCSAYKSPLILFRKDSSQLMLPQSRTFLPEQISRGMIDMIVSEGRHGEVAVIVPVLPTNIHFAFALSCFLEVLGQELALFVEIVRCTLFLSISIIFAIDIGINVTNATAADIRFPANRSRKLENKRGAHTTSIKISSGKLSPSHFLTNSVASCSAHLLLSSSPKYPPKAFFPQSQLLGFAMGANAETDLYLPGFFRKMVKAPWPPMLCPNILIFEPSICSKAEKMVEGSSDVM